MQQTVAFRTRGSVMAALSALAVNLRCWIPYWFGELLFDVCAATLCDV
jgi:hypothetical protein